MKTIILSFVSALFTSASMIHAASLDEQLNATFQKERLAKLAALTHVQPGANAENVDQAPTSGMMSMAMKSKTTTSTTTHTEARLTGTERVVQSKHHYPLSVINHELYKGPESNRGLHVAEAEAGGIDDMDLYDRYGNYCLIVHIGPHRKIWFNKDNRPIRFYGCNNDCDVVSPPVVQAPPPPPPVIIPPMPCPQPSVHYNIVREHGCYGEVTRVLKLTDAEFEFWKQQQTGHYQIPGLMEGRHQRFDRREHQRGFDPRIFDPRLIAQIRAKIRIR